MKAIRALTTNWRYLLIVLTLVILIVIYSTPVPSSENLRRGLTELQENQYLKFQIREIEKLFELNDRAPEPVETCNLVEPADIRPLRSFITSDFMVSTTIHDFPTCSLSPKTLHNLLNSVEVPNNYILAVTSVSQDFDAEPFDFLSNPRAKVLAFEDIDGRSVRTQE